MSKKTLLYIFLFLLTCSVQLVLPGSRYEDHVITFGASFQSVNTSQNDYFDLTAFYSTQDATGRDLKIRYKIEKPRPKPVSGQHYIREKIKGNADRGPKHTLLVLAGEILDYIPRARSLKGCLSFELISSWTGSSIKIRPPPVV